MEGSSGLATVGKANSVGKEMLKQLARTDPYYKRNRPHICSFFVKGECTRGAECPYRHEMPEKTELSTQNIRDRYHGTNDPVARKIMTGYATSQGLPPPDDTSITSLFLTSLPESATEQSIRTALVSSLPSVPPAQYKSVVHVAKNRCAFVNFTDRASAETAASAWAAGVEVDGAQASVKWGRSRPKAGAGGSSSQAGSSSSVAAAAS